MGAISFVIVLIQSISPLSLPLFLNFEFAHLLLFFAAITLAAMGLNNLLTLRRCKHMWTALEHGDNGPIVATYFRRAPRGSYRATRWLRHLLSLWHHDPRVTAEHLVLRHAFLERFGLADGMMTARQVDGFDFARYLRKSLTAHVSVTLEMSHLAYSVMALAFLLLMLLNLDTAHYLMAPETFLIMPASSSSGSSSGSSGDCGSSSSGNDGDNGSSSGSGNGSGSGDGSGSGSSGGGGGGGGSKLYGCGAQHCSQLKDQDGGQAHR